MNVSSRKEPPIFWEKQVLVIKPGQSENEGSVTKFIEKFDSEVASSPSVWCRLEVIEDAELLPSTETVSLLVGGIKDCAARGCIRFGLVTNSLIQRCFFEGLAREHDLIIQVFSSEKKAINNLDYLVQLRRIAKLYSFKTAS